MAWLDIFASDKIQEKAVDFVTTTVSGVGSWIDDLNFTEEEKNKSNFELLQFRLKVLKDTANESTARAISRRLLAWSITGVFIILVLIATIVSILGKHTIYVSILEILKLVYPITILVYSFYFVAGLATKHYESKK